MLHRSVLIPIASWIALGLGPISEAREPEISVVWQRSEATGDQLLKAFSAAELRALKSTKLREKGPDSDRPTEWKGPLLAILLEEGMKGLTAESRSQIDLVLLKGAKDESAWIPRSFVTRYPIVLALPGRQIVVPVSSRSKLQSEELPHGSYWVKGVQRIELTSYREQFGRFYLKRRTDPAAVRGEKVFIQNCMACHSSGMAFEGWKGDSLAELVKKHPRKVGYQLVSEKTGRALSVYWTAYRAEQAEKR